MSNFLGSMANHAIGLIETLGLTAAIEAADTAAKTADIIIDGLTLIGGGYVAVRFHGELASCQAALESAREAAQKVGRVVASKVIPRPEGDLQELLAQHEFSIGSGSTTPPSTPEHKSGADNRRPTQKRQSKPAEPAAPPPPDTRPKEKRPAPAKVAPPVNIKARPIATAKEEQAPPTPAREPQINSPAEVPPAQPQQSTEPSRPASEDSGSRFDMAALSDMPVVKLRKFARNIDDLPIQGREISMANKQELLEAIRSVNR